MNDQTSDDKHDFKQGDTTFISSTAGSRRAFLPGDIIDGSYQLTDILGHGGMGVVFACHHQALGKNYALKLLNGDQLSGEYWSRFQAEAKALAKLNHPGIVGVHNMGIDGGQYPYYVMDLLSGETLDMLIRKTGGISVNDTLDFFIQIADALSCAHSQGIIHRDIKPSNLMVVRDEQHKINAIKLVDFGIARLSNQAFAAQSQTATGLVFGTPFYMSPEQCQGIRVDERSDIYSLGCALFETLSGRPPFCGENAFDTFMQHQTREPPTLASEVPAANFPPSLELAVGKMLAKNTADRYQSMAQLKHDLERIKEGKGIMVRSLGTTIQAAEPQYDSIDEPKLSRSKAVWIILAVVIIGCGTAAALLSRPAKAPPPKVVIAPAKTETKPSTQIDVMKVEIGNLPNAPSPLSNMLNQQLASDQELRDIGASTKEIADFRKYDVVGGQAESDRFTKEFKEYIAANVRPGARFKRTTPTVEFQFPRDFIIGAIRFGQDKPIRAIGDIPVPAGKNVCFILSHLTKDNPEILDMFGPGDLNGLEIISGQSAQVIDKISRWDKLEYLSFFSTLKKSLPKYDDWDESNITDAQLPFLEHLRSLRSLGLCGDLISSKAILKMPLLHRLEGLKVKRIKDVELLIEALTSLQNIKELWLVSMPISDNQIKQLAGMKHLETLRIRRSSLTPASLQYFKQMPALKHLCLDRPWSDVDKNRFKEAIKGCEFEPVLDRQYWNYYLSPEKSNTGGLLNIDGLNF